MNSEKHIYSVPDGYFDSLRTRLSAIPAEHPVQEAEKVHTVTLWAKVRPYAAVAASLVMAFMVGNFFLGRTSSQGSSMAVEDYYYADLIPVTDPYAIYAGSPDTYQAVESSDEDAIEYLISSGASADYIAYLINE